MGTSVVIPGCWRVSMIFAGTSGLRAEMTFAVNDAQVIRDGARATTIAAAFKTWWDTNLKARTHPQWSLVQVYVLDVNSTTGTSLVYTTGLPIAGTSAGTLGPANAAPIITWRTLSRGRSYRGRCYLVGAPADAYAGADGTTVNATYRGFYNTAAAALITAIAAVDVPNNTYLGVASDVHAQNTRITTGDARTYVGTQRRRVSSP